MAEVYKKTLIHEWNFLGEERTEDERLTDTVGGVKVYETGMAGKR